MIWHIFKKDWKLLWRMAVAVAFLHFTLAAILFKLGRFGGDRSLRSLVETLFMIAFLGSAFLIAGAVHQDAIPGVRQDWLVRPVKRRDLLLAKLLFVLVVVQAPILAADFLQAPAHGFPVSQSFGAAASRSVYLLLGFSLPLLAFASLTRNFMEAIVAGLAAFLGAMMFMILFNDRGRYFDPTMWTGIAWVTESTRLGVALLGTAAVLGLQYFRRKTMPARWLTATVALLCLSIGFIPWQPAFAIQQQRAPIPGAGSLVVVAFAPQVGKFQRIPGIRLDDQNNRIRISEGDVFVYLPLRIAGLPDDSVLKADGSEVRLIGTDGRAENVGPGNDLEIRREGPFNSDKPIHHGIHVQGGLYNRIKDQPVRLEIDYSLTLLSLAASHALPALAGDQRMPDAGWCATKVNESGTAVQLRCLKPGKRLSCATVFLENMHSGRRNPERSFCSPDYAPYFGQINPDGMGRFGMTLPFLDPSGLAQYPVDGPHLRESQVVVRIYRPQDHFTRRLVIPEIRLKDWE